MTKWDHLPNEILELIIDKLAQEEDIEKAKWMKVNKQWYDQYQAIKYKSVTIRLDNYPCTILNNIIHSPFQPGKWIKNIIFLSLKASSSPSTIFFSPNLGFGGDPLYLLMSRSPNVKYVKLPTDKGISQMAVHTKDWIYFSNALIHTSTWKLQSLSLECFFHLDVQAKSQYYRCASHLRQNLRELTLTKGMMTTATKEQPYGVTLQKFQKLTSLVVYKDIVDNLQGCCTQLLKYLPHLEEMTIYFNSATDQFEKELEGKSASSNSRRRATVDIRNYFHRLPTIHHHQKNEKESLLTTTTTNDDTTTYPNIKRLTLDSYWQSDSSSTSSFTGQQQQSDISNLKRLINLEYLHMDVSHGSTPTFMVDSSILTYIDSSIPSYNIEFHTIQLDAITEHLDIYCNGLQNDDNNIRSSTKKNNKKYDLYVSFDNKLDESRGNTKVFFKKKNQASNGEIHLCIGFGGMDSFNRISAVKHILNHRNSVITGIYLDLHPPYYSQEDEEEEIGFYILGMLHYAACNKVCISRGAFIETPIEIMHHEEHLFNNHNSNITHLQFKKCYFNYDNESPLHHISARYPYLQHLEFDDCLFGNNMDELPYKARVELENTSIGTLSFYQSSINKEEGLVYDWNNTLFVSVVTTRFEKGYICTSREKGSKVYEIKKELLDVLKNSMDQGKCVCFVQVSVQSIHTLVFKVENKETDDETHFDITIKFP